MRRPLLVALLVCVGLALMANPLYLPLDVDEGDREYAHTVQPTENAAEPVDREAYPDDAVLDRSELDEEARDAFDRALDAANAGQAGFAVSDPDERVASLAYPEQPEPGNGIMLVSHEGGEHQFVTRTVITDPSAVAVQRIVVQPVAFLVGFLALVGAVAVGFRAELAGVLDPGETGD
ncbi:hypothetical protein JCM17823_27360 [Halorubrum gandharaense]